LNKYFIIGANISGTKQVGIKIDEDTLKILDDLPNSAVEMQVKDKVNNLFFHLLLFLLFCSLY